MIKKVIPEANKLISELDLVNFIKESIEKAAMNGLKSETFHRKSWGSGGIKTDDIVDYIAARKWDFKDLGYQVSFIKTEGAKVSGVIISWH